MEYGYSIGSLSSQRQQRRKPILFCVDSTAYTPKYAYTVQLSGHRRVLSIELVKAIIPNPDGDNYVILKIDGKNNKEGNTNDLTGAFCTIERTIGDNTQFVYKKNIMEQNPSYTYYYDHPAKLMDLAITLVRPDGTTPDYGVSNHFLVFEIHTETQQALPL